MYKVIAFYPNNLTKRQKKVSFMKNCATRHVLATVMASVIISEIVFYEARLA